MALTRTPLWLENRTPTACVYTPNAAWLRIFLISTWTTYKERWHAIQIITFHFQFTPIL